MVVSGGKSRLSLVPASKVLLLTVLGGMLLEGMQSNLDLCWMSGDAGMIKFTF